MGAYFFRKINIYDILNYHARILFIYFKTYVLK